MIKEPPGNPMPKDIREPNLKEPSGNPKTLGTQ